jgi:hypothetical protein
MIPLRLSPELWSCRVLPLGILQRWLLPDGAFVEAGDAVACVQIENGLHEIIAPAEGWLTQDCEVNAVVEPGMVIAHLSGDLRAIPSTAGLPA